MIQRAKRLLGAFEYWFRPQLRAEFGGPLNGSAIRRDAFAALHRLCPRKGIVETGTYRGDTAEFFAQTGLPVYTAELSPRLTGFCRARLWRRKNVRVYQGDCRSFLNALAADPAVPKKDVFFYLDAHWYDDLPLRDEVATIFRHWADPVVMIDDFQVPDDPGYRYDDYGEGRALTLGYLAPVAHLGYRVYFPAPPSGAEVGLKRGWVLLAADSPALGRLGSIPLLREWKGEPDACTR
jgi:hypothetical protein